MAGKKKNTEVVSLQKYKRKGHLNIGTILFGIIFLYLVFTVLIYFTGTGRKHFKRQESYRNGSQKRNGGEC